MTTTPSMKRLFLALAAWMLLPISARSAEPWQTFDEAITPEHTRQMAELIPGARLVILSDASRFAMWQRPEEFNATVRQFLAGKQPVSGRSSR
jgi:pimeloyl-ACP methyl ester carboxylesterase